jgi:hypothetical protein
MLKPLEMGLHLIDLTVQAKHHIEYTVAPVHQVVIYGDKHEFRVRHKPLLLCTIHGQVVVLPRPLPLEESGIEILSSDLSQLHGHP